MAVGAGLVRVAVEPSLCWRAVCVRVIGVVGVVGQLSVARCLMTGGSSNSGCAVTTVGFDVVPLDSSSEALQQSSSHLIRSDPDPLGLLDRPDGKEDSLTKVKALETVSDIEF